MIERNHATGPPITAKVDHFFAATDNLPTHLPARVFSPSVITLTVSPGGEGRVAIKTIDGDREVTNVDDTSTASRDQLARFFSLLDQAHFWETPTELPRRGFDGAEWIMEGVKDGNYRTVVRWCPEIRFGDAGHLLFDLAGRKHVGGC